MATKKSKGLGMGLEALLGPKVSDTAPASAEGAPTTLRLDLMQTGKYQPRTRMDEGSLYELAESIKAQGIMQPILVRPVGGGRYEIIAGERRSRAARLAGLPRGAGLGEGDTGTSGRTVYPGGGLHPHWKTGGRPSSAATGGAPRSQ